VALRCRLFKNYNRSVSPISFAKERFFLTRGRRPTLPPRTFLVRINIAVSGQYASWAARIFGLHSTIVLLAEDSERAREAYARLTRAGIERVSGYLAGGIMFWMQAGRATEAPAQISAPQLAEWLAGSSELTTLLDIREFGEWGGDLYRGHSEFSWRGGADQPFGADVMGVRALPKRLSKRDCK
jgi:hypothetical protein